MPKSKLKIRGVQLTLRHYKCDSEMKNGAPQEAASLIGAFESRFMGVRNSCKTWSSSQLLWEISNALL